MLEATPQVKSFQGVSLSDAISTSSHRKELGQYFTGMPLGRVLAHLAISSNTHTILDPMAGSGDLLLAAHEAALSTGVELQCLDAIEIDRSTASICSDRLMHSSVSKFVTPRIVCGDAFCLSSLDSITHKNYDLVITNPPYVRHQLLSKRGSQVREGLMRATKKLLSHPIARTWEILSSGYSGLADLSVPACLLSALLVRPGGRIALVIPATWRSRVHFEVIRYLLLRKFEIEIVVEDTRPGWFSHAAVCTHLIVARRLPKDQDHKALAERSNWTCAKWIKIAASAASDTSLVGRAFPTPEPELDFAKWAENSIETDLSDIAINNFSLEYEWKNLHRASSKSSWMRELEPSLCRGTMAQSSQSASTLIPYEMKDILPSLYEDHLFVTLGEIGIRSGQGLRTGCNPFFYVNLVQEGNGDNTSVIETNPVFGKQTLEVPNSVILPVLHKQAHLQSLNIGEVPSTRVLDLRGMILPEDLESIRCAHTGNFFGGIITPDVMPSELASYVRTAGQTFLRAGKNAQPVSRMSAVRSNARTAKSGRAPRFWYMLPDFATRHHPQAFVPRVVHNIPTTYANPDPRILVDANFSTFWSHAYNWSYHGMCAFLNCSWCQVIMEAVGTPLAGGALKIEAVHLRRMPVPRLGTSEIEMLNEVGRILNPSERRREANFVVLRSLLGNTHDSTKLRELSFQLDERRSSMCAARRGDTR